jgi:hypothetical protein
MKYASDIMLASRAPTIDPAEVPIISSARTSAAFVRLHDFAVDQSHNA